MTVYSYPGFHHLPVRDAFLVRRASFASLLAFSAGAQAQDPLTTFLQQQITDVPWIAVFLAFVVVALFAFRFQLRLRCEVVRRKQVEIEATEVRNRLNAILSNAGVGIMLADRYARHVDVNRRWRRIFGYQRSEGFLSLTDMLDRKIKAVQTKGLIYIDAITGKSKI